MHAFELFTFPGGEHSLRQVAQDLLRLTLQGFDVRLEAQAVGGVDGRGERQKVQDEETAGAMPCGDAGLARRHVLDVAGQGAQALGELQAQIGGVDPGGHEAVRAGDHGGKPLHLALQTFHPVGIEADLPQIAGAFPPFGKMGLDLVRKGFPDEAAVCLEKAEDHAPQPFRLPHERRGVRDERRLLFERVSEHRLYVPEGKEEQDGHQEEDAEEEQERHGHQRHESDGMAGRHHSPSRCGSGKTVSSGDMVP